MDSMDGQETVGNSLGRVDIVGGQETVGNSFGRASLGGRRKPILDGQETVGNSFERALFGIRKDACRVACAVQETSPADMLGGILEHQIFRFATVTVA